MNGNDYIEIIESSQGEIFEAWIDGLTFDDVPDEFCNEWVDNYLEGEGDSLHDRMKDEGLEGEALQDEWRPITTTKGLLQRKTWATKSFRALRLGRPTRTIRGIKMRAETLNKLFEVRNYFITLMPKEGERERDILDFLDCIIDEVQEWTLTD